MKIQGSLMQARFIEIHQVFAKKKVEYFSNKIVCLKKIYQSLIEKIYKLSHLELQKLRAAPTNANNT